MLKGRAGPTSHETSHHGTCRRLAPRGGDEGLHTHTGRCLGTYVPFIPVLASILERSSGYLIGRPGTTPLGRVT